MRRTRVRRIMTLSPTRYRSITWKDNSRLEIIKRLRIANRYRNFKVSTKRKGKKKFSTLLVVKRYLSIFSVRAFVKTVNYIARRPPCFLESLFSDVSTRWCTINDLFAPTYSSQRRAKTSRINCMHSYLHESTCTFVPEISAVEMAHCKRTRSDFVGYLKSCAMSKWWEL